LRTRFSTRIKIPDDLVFNQEDQEFPGRSIRAKRLNVELANYKTKILNICKEIPGEISKEALHKLRDKLIKPNKEIIKKLPQQESSEILSACKDYYRKCTEGIIRNKRTNGKLAKGTIENYYKVIVCLEEMLKDKNLVDKVFIKEWNLIPVHDDIEEMKRRVESLDNFYTLIIDYMTEIGWVYNTVFSRFCILKKMINDFAERNFMTIQSTINTPAPSNDEGDDTVIVLPYEMVLKLMKWDIDSFELDEGMKMAYDYSMLVLYSSKRIEDIWSLEEEDYSYKSVQDYDNSLEESLPVNIIVPYMAKKSKKTLASTSAVFPEKLDKLLNENLHRYGSRFGPLLREQSKNLNNWNSKLKYHMIRFYQQFDCMQEIKTVERVNPMTRKVDVRKEPHYKLAGPHTLRRTAISFMLAMGMSESHVKKFSGHTKDSKSFKKYHHVYEAPFIKGAKKYFDRTNSDSDKINLEVEIATVIRMPDNSIASFDRNNRRIADLSGRFSEKLLNRIKIYTASNAEWLGFDRLRSVSNS